MSSFLTKSKLLSASQCQKRLWLETYQGESGEQLSYSQQRRIEQGIEVGIYARQYFSQGILIEGETTEAKIKQTQNAIEKGEKCIFEATFSFDNIVVGCDIFLQQEPEKWQLIEVKSATKVKDEHIQDLAIQKYVLAGNDLFLSNIQVMYINRDCVYPDLSDLFIQEDVTQQLKGVFSNLPQLIRNAQNTLEKEQLPDINIGKHCDKPHPCPFKSFCWQGIEEPTVLSIPNLRGKKLEQVNDLITQGIYSLRDLPEDFPLTEKQAQAVEEKLNPEFIVNEQGILEKLLQLEYPLYFFDFETLNPAIPRFEGLQPYQQFPFQYSCHILHENGELEYHTYLHENETDPREKIIESLLETLGEKGSIIVYYQPFEAKRLGELAEQFPEYSTQLNAIKERLWDQWDIFKNDYQHPDFGGSTSLKKVLPVLVPEMSYDDLEIRDGDDAQAIWDLVIQGKAGDEKEKKLEDLKTYSEQDTYAMVAIHRVLLGEIIQDNLENYLEEIKDQVISADSEAEKIRKLKQLGKILRFCEDKKLQKATNEWISAIAQTTKGELQWVAYAVLPENILKKQQQAREKRFKELIQNDVEQWNEWKQKHSDLTIVLVNAKFGKANLSEADLSGANLSGANLSGAKLENTVFTGANLTNVNLDVNPNQIKQITDPSLLKKLAQNENSKIREAVAENPNLPTKPQEENPSETVSDQIEKEIPLSTPRKFALRDFTGKPTRFYRVQKIPQEKPPEAIPQPAHHIFILDVSGSMSSDLPDIRKTVEEILTLDEFNAPDLRVSLITYSSHGDVRLHFEKVTVEEVMTKNSPHIREIRNLQVRGLTCISQGLKMAHDLVDESETTCISLHSDGYANDISPYSEMKAIDAYVKELSEYENLFVHTIAYRHSVDFTLLDSIANRLSGHCIQAFSASQVYEALYDSTKLVTGNLIPATTIEINDADRVIFFSQSAKKVIGSEKDLKIRGISPEDDQMVYRFWTLSESEFNESSDPEIRDGNDSLADSLLTFARTSIAEGDLIGAKYALVTFNDKALLKDHYRALTNPEVAQMAIAIEETLFNPPQQLAVGGNYGFETGPSVLDVVRFLESYNRGFQVNLKQLKKHYRRRGLKRVPGTRQEDGTLQQPDYRLEVQGEETAVPVTNIEINRDTATINLKMVQNATLVDQNTEEQITEVAGVPLDKLKDYKNYTIVSEGEVTLSQLPIVIKNQNLAHILRELGLDVPDTGETEIELGSLPLIDFSLEGVHQVDQTLITKILNYQVLEKILSSILRDTSTKYTEEQIAEFKQYYLTPNLYFSPPTTNDYTDLKEALASGKVDTRTSYKIFLGKVDQNNASIIGANKLRSANEYLARRFNVFLSDEKQKKPTWDMFLEDGFKTNLKSLSSRTTLDSTDEIMMPIFEAFLGYEDKSYLQDILADEDQTTVKNLIKAISNQKDESEKIESLSQARKMISVRLKQLYKDYISPIVFYVGATGLPPFEEKAMDAEEITNLYPNLKLGKAEQEGLYYVRDGVLVSIFPKTEYFSVD